VIFDPHATHLPGISAANPGIKIRFANTNIVKQFPDQFAPFQDVFGCDLEHHYKGTLFRFPLRNSVLAESSEIKRRGYSHLEIVDLFKSFQGSIIDTMLFLRNVRKVEVYLQSEIGQDPVLLYDAEVPEEDRGESWRKIDRFMRNDEMPTNAGTTELYAKREFYSRLRTIPTEELPSVTQVLHIKRRQQKELQDAFLCFSDETSDALTPSLIKNGQMQETTEKYLVCNQIGGGKAREMACAAENESLKLIPWVGIAGRIDGVTMEGRAFCFLPLPVRVGLPVHINGYFELSSNRRDIWHGEDMTGDGKLRSEWNANLLVDAVAPAYLTFLLEAKSMSDVDLSQYLSFFPTKLPASPWDSIALELFRIMKNRPVFFASTTCSHLLTNPSPEANKSVAPSSSVLVDDNLIDWETLEIALSTASLETVHLPVALRNLLIQLDAVYGAMTPDFFRQLTRQGNFLPSLGQRTLLRAVQFCVSDCQSSLTSSTALALNQLPLLPLKDGKFGKLCFVDQSESDSDKNRQLQYFFGNSVEEQLLDAFQHRVVRGEFKQVLEQLPSLYDTSNVNEVDLDAILDSFLPHVLARCWSKTENDVYVLRASSQKEESQSREDWIRLLWTYVETKLLTIEQLPNSFAKWPLLPIVSDEGNRWVCLSANLSLVLPQSEAASVSPEILSQLQRALGKVGIHIVDTTFVTGEKSAQWLLAHKYAHKLTSNGILAALSRYQFLHERQSFDEIFAPTTPAERQILCDFLCQNTFNAVSDDFQSTLFELPVFAVHGKSRVDGATSRKPDVEFVSLRRGGYLPDAAADPRILDESFFYAEKDTARRFLRDCGVDEWSNTKIILDHVFPQLPSLDAQDRGLVDSVIISALEALPFHQRNDARFREIITSHDVIPSRKRVFRSINQLHDPSITELSELVGENSLPDHAFSSPAIVEILRSLGLRTSLSCHAVLESARSIELMCDGSVDQAYAKARSLLAIVNKHFDSMMSLSNSGETSADQEENNEAIEDIVKELKNVKWLPVRHEPLDPAMPWKSAGHQSRLSNALITRPLKDAVRNSSFLHFYEENSNLCLFLICSAFD